MTGVAETATAESLAPREDFPVLAREVDGNPVVYLDSAATSLTPRPVVDAIARYYTDVSANIHRGKHMLSEEASEAYEAARQRVARFVGAQANHVVFTANTTHGLNLVAAGLELSRDDVVLVSADAHHSLQLPLRARASVQWIPHDASGAVDLGVYADLLRSGPRVVALTHCSNVTGGYVPLAEMAEMARIVGALTIVDGAQSVPHRAVELYRMGIDALAFSAHKMLGPTGIGVLALSPRVADALRPALLGGGAVDWVDAVEFVLRRTPYRFEAGTPHIAGAYGLHAAVEYLERLGMAAVAAHDASMARLLSAEAAARDYVRVLGTGEERSGIVSFTLRGIADLGPIARALSDSYGVMCRTGHLCAQPYVDSHAGKQVLRMSTYVYSRGADVVAAFAALDELYPMFAGSS
jgi:cysteine desulfurase/selenocysteine lyase